MSQINENYEPFGPEWQKYMMTLPKKFLIELLKDSQLKVKQYEEKEQPGNIDGSIQKSSTRGIS